MEKKNENQDKKGFVRLKDCLKENYDVVLLYIVAFIVGIGVICGLFLLSTYLYNKAEDISRVMLTWNAAILAVLIGYGISFLLSPWNNWRNFKIQKRILFMEKRWHAYEEIIGFIFKFQHREGYEPQFSKEDVQQAYFVTNQNVLMWASLEVQRVWIRYMDTMEKKDNNWQRTVSELIDVILKELGQKQKRDSFYDLSKFNFLYGKTSFTLFLENDMPLTYAKNFSSQTAQNKSEH